MSGTRERTATSQLNLVVRSFTASSIKKEDTPKRFRINALGAEILILHGANSFALSRYRFSNAFACIGLRWIIESERRLSPVAFWR